jgi:hypothetical protein
VNGWTVILSSTALRDLRRLESGPKQAATDVLQELEEGPELFRAFEMRGLPDT